MFSLEASGSILRHFQIHVVHNTRRGTVTLNNVGARNLLKDLEKIWNTTTVSKYMFKSFGRYSLEFYEFFIPDIYFSLTKLMVVPQNRYRTNKRDLEKILICLEEETWFKDCFGRHPPCLDYQKLSQMKYTLLPAQIEALKAYEQKVVPFHLRGYLLAADVGTGKSIISTALSVILDADITIVVCPKYIVDSVWVDAVTVQFSGRKSVWKASSNTLPAPGFDFYIFHFEALDRAVEFFRVNRFKNPVIILDESHNLNDPKSKRTQLYLDMCRLTKSNNIIHASGTPISALGSEVIPLFRAIDPMFVPDVEIAFKGIYSKSATRALDILKNRLGMVSHKISKDVVMGDLKPIREELKIKLTNGEKYTLPAIKARFDSFISERTRHYEKEMPQHEHIYQEAMTIYEKTITSEEQRIKFLQYHEYVKLMRKGFDARTMGHMSLYCNQFEKEEINPTLPKELKVAFQKSKSVFKYVKLTIMGEFLGGILGRMRVELHSELIEHSGIDRIVQDAKKKTICFTDYVDTALVAKRYFEVRGFEPLIVYAETNKDVHSILETFKTSDTANPLVATIRSLSTGVTLVVANVCIFLNLPYRSKDYEQASARVFRIGQDTQVYLYDLLLDTGNIPNLSTRLSDIMTWSADQIEKIVGKGNDLPDTIYPSLEAFIDIPTMALAGLDYENKNDPVSSVFNWT